jgi:hypothetical protein
MSKIFLKFLFAFLLLMGLCVFANGQAEASTPNGRPDPSRNDLPEGIRETLAKQKIKSEEKEYQELVKRGEEAAKLGEELNNSLENNQSFTAEDVKKIERLEKLVKKIRNDLGAEDDSEKNALQNERSQSLQVIVKNIKEDAANLLSEIKKIGRHSISVIAIESSNTLLKLVRFLRFNKN